MTCAAIREVEGSAGDITSLAVDLDGTMFVSGGEDKLVRMWDYDESRTIAVGVGHSGSVKRIAISPDQTMLVSVGGEGAIFLWNAKAPSGEVY